jgi:hypothetical protein
MPRRHTRRSFKMRRRSARLQSGRAEKTSTLMAFLCASGPAAAPPLCTAGAISAGKPSQAPTASAVQTTDPNARAAGRRRLPAESPVGNREVLRQSGPRCGGDVPSTQRGVRASARIPVHERSCRGAAMKPNHGEQEGPRARARRKCVRAFGRSIKRDSAGAIGARARGADHLCAAAAATALQS